MKLVSWTEGVEVPGSWDTAEGDKADYSGLQTAQAVPGCLWNRRCTRSFLQSWEPRSGGFVGEAKATWDHGNVTEHGRGGAELLWRKGQKCWKLIQESRECYWRVICVKNLLAVQCVCHFLLSSSVFYSVDTPTALNKTSSLLLSQLNYFYFEIWSDKEKD